MNRDTNHKKMLCQNIIEKKPCNYGSKCLYAHSIEEQNVNGNRKIAYDYIINNKDMSDIDLSQKEDLFSSFKELSRTCEKCIMSLCTGGYNCKYGSCKKEYTICLRDITIGNCDGSCNKKHLTKNGLKPNFNISDSISESSYSDKSEEISEMSSDDEEELKKEEYLERSIFEKKMI